MTNSTKTKTAKNLNPKQKKFCELYTSDRELFGNGVYSYAEAYGIDMNKKGGYHSAGVCAHRLLKNVKILSYINKLLDSTLNDQFIDKQMAFLVTQNADFGSKLGAIREYNKLKQRITERIDQTIRGDITFVENRGEPKC